MNILFLAIRIVGIDLKATDDNAAVIEQADPVAALDMGAAKQVHYVGLIDLAVGQLGLVADPRSIVGDLDGELVHTHDGDAVIGKLDPTEAR